MSLELDFFLLIRATTCGVWGETRGNVKNYTYNSFPFFTSLMYFYEEDHKLTYVQMKTIH